MITFKADIVSSNRRKDGTYMVVIRVTFKGKSRRLPTTLSCSTSDLTRSLKIKSADILNKAEDLILQMREVVKDLSPFTLDYKDVDWVVSYIKTALSGKNFRLDFFEWAEQAIRDKNPATQKIYRSSVSAFERFLGKRQIDINEITRAMLLEFVEYNEKQNKIIVSPRTGQIISTGIKKLPYSSSKNHLSCLHYIFTAAKARYNDEDSDTPLIPRSPFNNINLEAPIPKGQPNIGKDLMQRIISYQTTDKKVRLALDVFVVSFALMGANLADLYNAEKFEGEWWIYNRQKTKGRRADGAEMRVLVPAELAPYLGRLKGHGKWWLNELHWASKSTLATDITHWLGKWCRQEGIKPFTLYAARHTFASLAREQGVDKSTIDDCLCHKGSYQMADIYAEKAWNVMQDANRKVIDMFTWE